MRAEYERPREAAQAYVEAHGEELAHSLHAPTDEELGEAAAAAYKDFQARGYAHLSEFEVFARGFGAAIRFLLSQQHYTQEVSYVVTQ